MTMQAGSLLPRLAARSAATTTARQILLSASPLQPAPRPFFRAHRSSSTHAQRQSFSTSPNHANPLPQVETTINTPRTQTSLPEFNLAGRVVLVTGAGRGLGLSLTQSLLEAGAKVYALDRLAPEDQSPDFTRIQKHASAELNTSLQYRQIDVRDVAALNKTVTDIADAEGRMDGLVAAAGIQQETPALDYTQEDANRMFATNVTGVMMTAQCVAKQMIRFKRGGSMAFIASMSGSVANRGLICSAYNASKAGVIQLGRNLASEWGEHGIRVNTISPGYIVTQMVEDLFKTHPERREQWANQNMLGRVSLPEDYRAAAVFLMGDGSRFMTASDMRIDGGHSAW